MLTLAQIKGVGDATIKKLQELDIKSVFELFSFFPSKYIDLKSPISIAKALCGQLNLFEGTVERISSVSPRGKRAFYISFCDTLAVDDKIHFKVTFYNMPFMQAQFAIGQKYRILGKLAADNGRYEIVNPQIEKIEKIAKLDGMFTVYPLKGVMGQNTFKNIIGNALDELERSEYEGKFAHINEDMSRAFLDIHRPCCFYEVERAYERLAAIDIATVLSIYRKLKNSAESNRKVFYNFDNFRTHDYISALPYLPTLSQKQAFDDILNDLNSKENMSRIVSGDVGSGKTAVAFFAMCAAARGGRQTALMAPTEILAEQHFKKFSAIASKLNISCAMLTSSVSAQERKNILNGLKSGVLSCVIGTQALVADAVEYSRLSLAVIDEQHKFGVNERRLLEQKGAVDILSLTATPIPRSMALTFYDDIKISNIKKRDDAMANIKTELIFDINDGISRIATACRHGKQAFVVCPSIVDAEGYSLMSIESFMRDYGHLLEGINVRILHGKMAADEKAQAMLDFAQGNVDLLVATTVVEVGIDTCASEILILNADRFGLASLHQLRGRVGRDGSEAHCYIQCSSVSEKAAERLEIFRTNDDGYVLAEADFTMRGAGDFIGTRQSGASVTPIFGLNMSAEVLKEAKRYADQYLSDFTLDELTSLTRRSKARVEQFISDLNKVTLKS